MRESNGPPWRDLPEKGGYRCNIMQEKPVKLRPCESGLPAIWQAGLGQGALEYWNTGPPWRDFQERF